MPRRHDRPTNAHASRWFDPTLQAAPSAHTLRKLIDDIATALLANEPPRKRARKDADMLAWRTCVEAIVCNCIGLPQDGRVLIRLSPRHWTPHRYFRPPFGHDTCKRLLEAMDGEFVALDTSAWRGKASHYRPSETLAAVLEGGAWGFRDLQQSVQPETIILTGDNTEDGSRSRARLPYKDTSDTRRYREEMRIICEAFAKADIRFVDDGLGQVHTDRRALRRYFQTLPDHEHMQWKCGGRIYSEWLSHLSRDRRRSSLLIDTVPCREVDYGSLHLRIASAEAGVVLPEEVDPYAISGFEASQRPALKVLLNAMLTARGSLKHFPEGFLKDFPEYLAKEWPVKRVRAAMIAKHPQLEGVLGDGTAWGGRVKGDLPPAYRLQFVESTLLVEVLLECARRRVTALPLHDGVLVADGREEEAKDVMLEVALRRRLIVPVSVKGGA